MQAPKFEKFIKLMKMTTSPNEGEALNAVRMANSLLLEANLDWDDFLRGKAKISADGSSPKSSYSGKKYTNSNEIESMLNQVLATIKSGTSFHGFVESLNDWWEKNQFLTEKQYNALRKTYERL